MSVPDHVENPSAWLDGKARRIKANANKTRRAKLVEAVASDSEEFRAWLFNHETPALDAMREASQAAFDRAHDDSETPEHIAYHAAYKAWRKRVGVVPEFILKAIDDWGGLTEKQLAFARKAFQKNVERAEGRDAAENARRASAPSWTSGRQRIEGTIQMARLESIAVGPRGYHSSTSCKALLTIDDGRKLWTSLPRSLWLADTTSDRDDDRNEGISALRGTRVSLVVTIEPSKDDATMAFGKRPSEAPEASQMPVESTNAAPEGETPADAKRRRARERRAKRKAAKDAK